MLVYHAVIRGGWSNGNSTQLAVHLVAHSLQKYRNTEPTSVVKLISDKEIAKDQEVIESNNHQVSELQ